MYEPYFWASSAEAMELTIEGNRLIANEIAHGARALWRRVAAALEGMLQTLGRQGHLPPV